MFEKIKEISETGRPQVFKEDLFLPIIDKEKYFIIKVDENLKMINKTVHENIFGFKVVDNLICYYTREKKTFVASINFKVITKINESFDGIINPEKNLSHDYYIGNTSKSGFIIYDFKKNKIHHTLFPERINRAAILIDNSSYLLYQPGGIVIEKYNFPQELQWQADISEIGASENWFDGKLKGEIRNIYTCKNKVIVLARGGIVTYNIETGKTIWERRNVLSGAYLTILENIGYFNNGLYILKVNLDNGEILNLYDNFKDFIIDGEAYYPDGSELVYHDNLFWSSVNSSGKAIIVALNPENFEYVWWQEIKGADHIRKPVFYKNKMFIRDISNVLHIFEKEV